MAQKPFIERRKDYRLPYMQKIIFTDGVRSLTGNAMNISRGGLFVMTLDPLPVDTQGYMAFLLPHQPTSLCLKAKVAHIVFDRQRAEVECGMGFQFVDLDKSHRTLLNSHVMEDQANYLQLREVLRKDRPDAGAISTCIKRLPNLAGLDLPTLRYRVNRICTIFESGALGSNSNDEPESATG